MFKLLKTLIGFEIPLDIYIAVGLVAIVVVVALIKWIGILPTKSLPFLFAALLGALGYSVFQRSRSSALLKDIKRREKEIRKKEKNLRRLKKDADASESALREAQDKLIKERAALQKELLLIDMKNEEEKRRIAELPVDELFREFDRVFGGKKPD